jgi:hypothetical protein
MGVAFDLEVTPSRAAAKAALLSAAIAASGLVLCAVQLGSGPTLVLHGPPDVRIAVAAACALVAVALMILALRTRRIGADALGERLEVGPDGEAALCRDGPGPGRRMRLRAACVLPGLTLLVLAPYLPQPGSWRRVPVVTLVLGRDAVSADAWRRLHVWLRWIERGRHGRPGPAPDLT